MLTTRRPPGLHFLHCKFSPGSTIGAVSLTANPESNLIQWVTGAAGNALIFGRPWWLGGSLQHHTSESRQGWNVTLFAFGRQWTLRK